MATEVYAKAVVDELTKASPSPWFWFGAHSFMAWFLATFMKRASSVCPLSCPYMREDLFLPGRHDYEGVRVGQTRRNRARVSHVIQTTLFS